MTRELPEDQHNWASKLVITGTGFFGNSRKLLRQSVQETGAQYSGDLLCGCTTHLVCKSLDAARSGTKYVRAAEWDIPAVHLGWWQDCVTQQAVQPVEAYTVGSSGSTAAAGRPQCSPAKDRNSAAAATARQPNSISQRRLLTCKEVAAPSPCVSSDAGTAGVKDQHARQFAACDGKENTAIPARSEQASCLPEHGTGLQAAQQQQPAPTPPQHASRLRLKAIRQRTGSPAQLASTLPDHAASSTSLHALPTAGPQPPHPDTVNPTSFASDRGAQQCSGFGGGGAQQEAHLEDLVIPDSQPASEYTPHSWTQHQHGLLRYQQHAAASLPSICNARSQGSAAYISSELSSSQLTPAQAGLASPAGTSLSSPQLAHISLPMSASPAAAPSCSMDDAALSAVHFQSQEASSRGEGHAGCSLQAPAGQSSALPPAGAVVYSQPDSEPAASLQESLERMSLQDSQQSMLSAGASQQAADHGAGTPSPSATPRLCCAAGSRSPADADRAQRGAATNTPAPKQPPAYMFDLRAALATPPGAEAAESPTRHSAQARHSNDSLAPVEPAASDMHCTDRHGSAACGSSGQDGTCHGTLPDAAAEAPGAASTTASDSSDSDFVSSSHARQPETLPASPSGHQPGQQRAAPWHSNAAASTIQDTASMAGASSLPPARVIARPEASTSSTSDNQVALKLMVRPARGNTVKEFHGLRNLKDVQFAEEVQILSGSVVLSTKEKKRCATVKTPGRRRSSLPSDGGHQPIAIAEPHAFYKMPSGEWWMEYQRMYSAAELEQEAVSSGQAPVLPPDLDRSSELLRSITRSHCRLGHVTGLIYVRRSKQVGRLRRRAGDASLFWRSAIDIEQMRCVTDRPVSDFCE